MQYGFVDVMSLIPAVQVGDLRQPDDAVPSLHLHYKCLRRPKIDPLIVLLCQKSFSLRIAHGSAGKISLKVEREQHAQGGDGVRDMALRALDCREGCNPRERQAPRVE
jgi:hypothetical protein